MRLVSFLKLAGGIPEQGRPVTFRVRYAGPDNVPYLKDVQGQLLPVSEAELAATQRAAAQYCATPNASLPQGEEELVRLLQASLRDCDDPRIHLIEDETDLAALRAGLVAPQYDRLLAEYRALIEQQYPLHPDDDDVAEAEKDARDFSHGDQPAPG